MLRWHFSGRASQVFLWSWQEENSLVVKQPCKTKCSIEGKLAAPRCAFSEMSTDLKQGHSDMPCLWASGCFLYSLPLLFFPGACPLLGRICSKLNMITLHALRPAGVLFLGSNEYGKSWHFYCEKNCRYRVTHTVCVGKQSSLKNIRCWICPHDVNILCKMQVRVVWCCDTWEQNDLTEKM